MSCHTFEGLGDFHSHLLPGVDDGARSLTDTLESVGRMVAAGFRRVVTTPHVAASVVRDGASFASLMERMDDAWQQALEEVGRAYPGLHFGRGHEVLLDVADAYLEDPRLWLDRGPFVLVEWPLSRVPIGSETILGAIRSDGLVPVVAHPERYPGVTGNLDLARAWREAGAYLQLNYGSLVGHYGPGAKLGAFRLLTAGLADYLCTDFHGRPNLELPVSAAREACLEHEGGEGLWRLLSQVNPNRLADNLEPLPVPALPAKEGLWDHLRRLLRSRSE